MNNYKAIAFRYLKLNKKRSIVTVLGVVVAVTVLYAILNIGWSVLLMQRESLREIQDYEIVFLTEDAAQAEQIMADERIESVSVGSYYDGNYYEPVMYENALYVNVNNPYRMEKILEDMQNTYGVEGKLNKPLAATYMQGNDSGETGIIIIGVLLLTFIFAVFGVGIVRNSIQLSILEQIKDYGNLRCIGSTKTQLRTVVYIQGAVLELIGNVIGILLGFLLSMVIGAVLHWEIGFHLVPMIPILIAFLGDLYFVMEENCKVVVKLTPVGAIRGEYRIRKEKLKFRRPSIFGKLLGVEGDYAYKSIMRNPGRFHKTVWALGIGMAAFMAVMSGAATINGYIERMKEQYGYYPVSMENILDTTDTMNDVLRDRPSTDMLERITNMSEVTEAKRIYSSYVILNDSMANFSHYREEYLTDTGWGSALNRIFTGAEGFEYSMNGSEDDLKYRLPGATEIPCYGYDEADYQRYQQVLVEGTLDISENGLVLVNEGSVPKAEDEALMPGYMDVVYTDYKVGDTIDILDMERYRTMLNEKLSAITVKFEKEMAELPPLTQQQKDNPYIKTPQDELKGDYWMARSDAAKECKKQLLEEGAYKTYTIEGIVSRDVNYDTSGVMAFIFPLDRYYAFTGTDESAVTGMRYHFEKFSAKKLWRVMYSGNISAQLQNYYEASDWLGDWYLSSYVDFMNLIESMRNVGIGIILFIIFVVLMSTFNIINTTASNLHLRRREFAQLRVVGISKKRLMKMVMLEGVISSVVANVIGIVLGITLTALSMGQFMHYLFGEGVRVPIPAMLIGIVVSTLITCGSIYVPLKGLKQDMAADLATGGD